MWDGVFMAITLAFFAAALGFVLACEHLMREGR